MPNTSSALRVLVVANDAGIVSELLQLFQPLPCHCAAAYGPGMALRIARAFRPQLVVIVAESPGRREHDFVAAVRALNLSDGTPMLACFTNNADTTMSSEGTEREFDVVEVRPMSSRGLQDLVARARLRAAAARPRS